MVTKQFLKPSRIPRVCATALLITSVVTLVLMLASHVEAQSAVADPQGPSAAQSPTPQPEPSAKPDVDYWHQEWLTGDWGRERLKLREKGVELNFRLTQAYAGVAGGGLGNSDAYAGKFDTHFKFDMGRLAGWKGFSWQIKTETRFGKTPFVGNLLPTETFTLTPLSKGTVFAITSLNFTQLLALDAKKGKFIAFGAGKYYSLDSYNEPFYGGSGHTTFLNIAFNSAPTGGRVVPTVTNGGTFAWIRKGNPFLTFALFDATGSPTTTGLGHLFADGVSFVGGINFPTNFGKKSGKQSFSASTTTKKFTPFDQLTEVIIPGPAGTTVRPKAGSWTLTYSFHQYLMERAGPGGAKTGWGLFGIASVADKTTNPLSSFFSIGLGGTGLFQSRRNDRFGIAYAHTGISGTLKREISPLIRLGNEQVFEMFYNFALTPFIKLTGDLQVVRPGLRRADTAVIPGVRLVINF